MLTRFLYSSYRWFYVVEKYRKQHLTAAGILMVFCCAVAGFLGINVSQTTLYQAVTLAFFALVISIVCSFFFRFKGSVKRVLPPMATVGEKTFYQIEIFNDSSANQKDLVLFEDFRDPRPTRQELVSKKEPFEHLRNRWDKRTYYYRWLWLVRQNKRARFEKKQLPDLPSQSRTLVTSSFIPHNRGYIQLSGICIARPDPLGLFMATQTIQAQQHILVLPKMYALQHPKLKSHRKYHAGGVALASSIGNSDEFMSLRDYRPGDPMRNIHWKTFAKKNKLIIKEFEDEYFIRHALILDTFLNTGEDQVFEEAVSIAASYLSSFKTHESILDLMFVGNTFYSFSSGRGLAHTQKMLEIVACVESQSDKPVSSLSPVIQEHLPKLSGSICIFLDWDQDRKRIVDIFQTASVPVFIIVVCRDKNKMQNRIFQETGHLKNLLVVQTGQVEKDLNS
ncbi:MAG: DUF58 domain-containing protein [Desulfobacteraceae bacterium]|nr:DUF58 domain-containing protein [Desulfobacteraceae bacterium]